MNPIRILIVDDHPTVRRGLRSLLSSYPDLEVVGEVSDGLQALTCAASLAVDIILLDVLLPGKDGIAVARQLGQVAPLARIIVLTAFGNEEYVLGALAAGAFAYLLKSTSDQTLVETIRLVYQGKRFLSPDLIDQVLRQFQTLAKEQLSREAGLDEAEVKVLALIAQGATNEEIAAEMYWSERTVKRKVEEIMSQLRARNRAQAVAEAVKRGLI